MMMKQWSVVRQAAGLLKKTVTSLTVHMGEILIRSKPVTVGFGNLEYFIANPLSPEVLTDIIYTHW
jgi:hypothetical protein